MAAILSAAVWCWLRKEQGGLLHRAISQSGGIFRHLPELNKAGHARSQKVAAAVDASSLEQMRAASTEDLLAAYSTLAKTALRFGAIVDGKTIPAQTISLFKSGNYNRLPATNDDAESV